MGLASLTAVFGMGTGVTLPAWSPENRPKALSLRLIRRSEGFTVKPISRLSLLVCDRCNPDHILELEIKEVEGEAVERAFPVGCILVGRPAIRMLLDQIDDMFHFRSERKTESRAVVTRRKQSHRRVPLQQPDGKARTSLVLLSKLTEDKRGWFATGFSTA